MNPLANHILLSGSSFEVGKALGGFFKENPELLNTLTVKEPYLSKEDELQLFSLFDDYCPGINEEIAGFAEALSIPPVQVLYYAETYLCPGCSQIPAMSANGHTPLARNYDFKDGIEIFGGDLAKESADLYEAYKNTDVPPAGAFVFYDCSGDIDGEYRNWGHVGLSMGNAKVFHAWDKVRVENYLDIENLISAPGWNQPRFIGWVPIERVLVGFKQKVIKQLYLF